MFRIHFSSPTRLFVVCLQSLETIARTEEEEGAERLDDGDNDNTPADTDGPWIGSGLPTRFPGNVVSLFLFRLAEGCIVVGAIPLRGHCLTAAGEGWT